MEVLMRKLILILSVTALAVGLMALPLSAQQWPNHKMHFPQLPDLIGWDVMATSSFPPPGQGTVLADDWQCTRTGPVEDIHFWGSWKDQDGNPATDDSLTSMPWFTIGIWSNDPGTPPRPAILLRCSGPGKEKSRALPSSRPRWRDGMIPAKSSTCSLITTIFLTGGTISFSRPEPHLSFRNRIRSTG